MGAAKDRPVFLNLFKIHFPCTAIISIAHRVSGVLLFVSMPLLLLLLSYVKQGGHDCPLAAWMLHHATGRVMLWAVASAYLYHMIAGVRHLWMDYAGQHGLCWARGSAWAVMVVALVVFIVTGVTLW